MRREEIDAIDLKILRLLQHNADYSMQELARQVGMSHAPCWRRCNRLKASGVIARYAAMIDPKKVGVSMTAICDVILHPHDEEVLVAFEKAVLTCPEIVACFAMTGPRDYVLRIAIANLQQYELFFQQKLLRLPGVATVNTSFAFDTVKWTTALPL